MFGNVTFIVSLCVVFIMICQTDSAHLHAPTNLSAKWIDHLTVNVSWSWTRPEALPPHCDVWFRYKLNGEMAVISTTHFLENLLTESSVNWTCSVCTISRSCPDYSSIHSEAEIVIAAPKPRAEVIDFKCYLSNSDMNCSWIPNSFSPLSLSYRDCGKNKELLKEFKQCDQIYDSGPRRVCRLKGNFLPRNLCMVTSTPNGISTFIGPKALSLPKEMKISEEGTNLVLKLMPLDVQVQYLYNICYSVCNVPMGCLQNIMEERKTLKIPHDKSCMYRFQYQARTNQYSTVICTDWSEEILYGSTDWTLTVVAIVIPLIISFCVILSCICFRRHKDIICPDVPDPSAIFKEMINGNKENKLKVHMYSPVQEPIERIIIVPHIPPSSGPFTT